MAGVDNHVYESFPDVSSKLEENVDYIHPKQRTLNTKRPFTTSYSSKWKCFLAMTILLAGLVALMNCATLAMLLIRNGSSDEISLGRTNEKLMIPYAREFLLINVPSVTFRNCKEIKRHNSEAKSGNYFIKLGATQRVLLVYCDHDTSGGGWTLVYSYEFTNYDNFYADDNAVTPIPSWPGYLTDVKVSTLIPENESERGAMKFAWWKYIGSEFLVKSNINNWVRCSPQGGSLVQIREGPINCEMIKEIHKCSQGINAIPDNLKMHPYGPSIMAGGSHYCYWDGSTKDNWPTHDPCAAYRQKLNVPDPHGAVYLR